jgi:hypothetical protein
MTRAFLLGGLQGGLKTIQGIANMGSHRLLGTVRVASLQRLENGLMLLKSFFGATGLRTGLEAIETQLVVELFHQKMLQPFVVRAANDLEMEILVLRSLIIARGAEHGWIRAMTVQQALQGRQLVVRDSLGG